MKSSKPLKLNGKEYVVKKIPIGKFAELMLAVEKLPNILLDVVSLEELENLDTPTIIAKLPSVLASAQDEFFKLVSVATGIEVEEIRELDFEEFIDVVTVIFELNNIQSIVNKVKNLKQTLQRKAK
jgi:hypothetical protein